MRRTTIWRTVHPSSKDKGMFLSKFFKRRRSVVQRIEAYTAIERDPWGRTPVRRSSGEIVYLTNQQIAEQYPVEPDCGCHKATTVEHITVNLPATVDGALLATQIEHQLKRRGLH